MTEYLEAVILGVIQGLTEFLPVSSSGHLEIAKHFFGENAVGEESLMMTVVLHFATALSTIVVFWKDIIYIIKSIFKKEGQTERIFVGYIILSMIPAAIIGIGFEEGIESFFSDNLLLVSLMLLVTAGLLYFANSAHFREQPLTKAKSIVIGIAQAIAIIPGISRSGATIGTSLLLGIDKTQAARFSFLMVVPLILGKVILDIGSGELMGTSLDKTELALGFIAAFFTGILACQWMIAIVKKSKLSYFALYCAIIALIGLSYVFFS